MSRYRVQELGEVQKKILKHYFICTRNGPESESHISKEISVLQPSVHRAVDLLIKANYLTKAKEYTRGAKALTLTNKGAAAAVLLGVNFDQLKDHIDLRSPHERPFLEFLLKSITIPEKRDFLIKKVMEYALENDFFEQGNARALTKEEAWKLQIYIATEMAQSMQPNVNIKEYLDKYGINKGMLKEHLKLRRKFLDLMIRQLDDDTMSH